MKQVAASLEKNKSSSLGQWTKLAILGIVLAIAYWIVLQYDITEYLQPARFVEFIQTFGVMAPIVFVGLMALAVVVSPIPSIH